MNSKTWNNETFELCPTCKLPKGSKTNLCSNSFHLNHLPEKVEVRETDVSGEMPRIVKFLLGEAAYDGYWFGDKPMDRRGEFWWRRNLREEFEKEDVSED